MTLLKFKKILSFMIVILGVLAFNANAMGNSLQTSSRLKTAGKIKASVCHVKGACPHHKGAVSADKKTDENGGGQNLFKCDCKQNYKFAKAHSLQRFVCSVRLTDSIFLERVYEETCSFKNRASCPPDLPPEIEVI